jgi:hypothetical protein
MLLGEIGNLLLGWWATEHMDLSKSALVLALETLSAWGVIARLGKTLAEMKDSMSNLWMVNCCQDFDVGNACGLVSIEVAGGQVNHFMRDKDGDPKLAYTASYNHIHECLSVAHGHFREAFPTERFEGITGWAKEKAAQLSAYMSLQQGLLNLGRALHTLQDSFSPSHVKREEGTFTIEDVFCWDDNNKNERKDGEGKVIWPGHKPYDRKDCGFCPAVSLGHYKRAEEASAMVIIWALQGIRGDGPIPRVSLDLALSGYLKQTI